MVDLNLLPDLLGAIRSNTPLAIEAETVAIYYRGGIQTGAVDGAAFNSPATATGLVSGIKFANEPAAVLDRFPADVNYLVVKTATASGILHIRKAG